MQFKIGNTDYPDILERCIEIKGPFPDLSKEWLALVESSLGKTRLMKSNFNTIRHPDCFFVVTKLKYVQNVGNYRKIYFPSRVNHPEKHNIITDSSKVNVRYLSIEELQSKLEMAQKTRQNQSEGSFISPLKLVKF